MILILIHYDPKFVQPVCTLFRHAAEDVIFVVEALSQRELPVVPPDVQAVVRTPEEFRQIVQSRSDWDGAIVQCMSPGIMRLLKVLPSSVPVAWRIWGFEAYNYWPALTRNLYLPITKRYHRRHIDPSWKNWLRPWFYRLSGRLDGFSRVRLFLSLFQEEYDLLRNVGLLSGKADFCWCSTGLSDPGNQPIVSSGDDILLGNSATPENNHVDTFSRLARMDLQGRSVVVPLSYGNMQYRDWVLRQGKRLLGHAFEPLVDFLPRAEYFKILKRCGISLMNHLRQQALGNIFMQLRLGSNVYLNDTPVYRGLVRQGFYMSRLDQALAGVEDSPGLGTVSSAIADRNRELVKQIYSPDSLIQAARDVVARLRSIQRERRDASRCQSPPSCSWNQ